jgi:uncharacterized membrane protein
VLLLLLLLLLLPLHAAWKLINHHCSLLLVQQMVQVDRQSGCNAAVIGLLEGVERVGWWQPGWQERLQGHRRCGQ